MVQITDDLTHNTSQDTYRSLEGPDAADGQLSAAPLFLDRERLAWGVVFALQVAFVLVLMACAWGWFAALLTALGMGLSAAFVFCLMAGL